MATILEPTPAVYEVRVETPLDEIYARRICVAYGVNYLSDLRITMIQKIARSEPEFGRGLVFWVRGTAASARRQVEKVLAKAEALFDERERGSLAREAEIERSKLVQDANAGF